MRGTSTRVVTIGGWVYIASGLLGFLQFPKFHATGEQIVAVAGLVMCLAVGVGLLMRRNWARWVTLGMSLLTWTLGSLALIWAIVTLLQSLARARGMSFPLLAIWLFVYAIVAIFIWLNFRLFERLNSEAGRDEFNTPETESLAVAKSTAACIAWCAACWIVVQSGGSGAERDRRLREIVDARAGRPEQEQAATAPIRSPETAAIDARANAEKVYLRKLQDLSYRRVSDRSYTDAQYDADRQELDREFQQLMDSAGARSHSQPAQPAQQAEPAGEPRTTAILKCRDASGATTYTQGYCPPGTSLVESPAN